MFAKSKPGKNYRRIILSVVRHFFCLWVCVLANFMGLVMNFVKRNRQQTKPTMQSKIKKEKKKKITMTEVQFLHINHT